MNGQLVSFQDLKAIRSAQYRRRALTMGAAASTGQQPQPTTRDFEMLLASEDSGVEFHGVLSQGGSELDLSYRINAPITDCPAIVQETRASLGWNAAPPELVCDASCSIASFGMDREPMLAALDTHPTDRKLRVEPIRATHTVPPLHTMPALPNHLSKPGIVCLRCSCCRRPSLS